MISEKTVDEVSKSQKIRVVDIYILGPFMIYLAYKLYKKKPISNFEIITLGFFGASTIYYNWNNYKQNKNRISSMSGYDNNPYYPNHKLYIDDDHHGIYKAIKNRKLSASQIKTRQQQLKKVTSDLNSVENKYMKLSAEIESGYKVERKYTDGLSEEDYKATFGPNGYLDQIQGTVRRKPTKKKNVKRKS